MIHVGARGEREWLREGLVLMFLLKILLKIWVEFSWCMVVSKLSFFVDGCIEKSFVMTLFSFREPIDLYGTIVLSAIGDEFLIGRSGFKTFGGIHI